MLEHVKYQVYKLTLENSVLQLLWKNSSIISD